MIIRTRGRAPVAEAQRVDQLGGSAQSSAPIQAVPATQTTAPAVVAAQAHADPMTSIAQTELERGSLTNAPRESPADAVSTETALAHAAQEVSLVRGQLNAGQSLAIRSYTLLLSPDQSELTIKRGQLDSSEGGTVAKPLQSDWAQANMPDGADGGLLVVICAYGPQLAAEQSMEPTSAAMQELEPTPEPGADDGSQANA